MSTPQKQTFAVDGLENPVEILVDQYGVPHMYAQSVDDLFLAQGFNAARDRLFQIDLWRRRGLGLLSEVFGASFVERDRAARLFLYRGDMDVEWPAYGPATRQVTEAFVRGINAYVALCAENPSLLPVEFVELGYLPSTWDVEEVARIRSHGLYYNLDSEVARALILRDFGPAVEDLRRVREPAVKLTVPDGLNLSDIPEDVLRVYWLATSPPPLANAASAVGPRRDPEGSNNWVIAPDRSATGRPLLANDPHRSVSLPSLRYLSHLVGPGLNVIGAGEPALPGISIGHNGRIAFGLTIFSIDQEDLYVYETSSDDRSKYRYGDGHESTTIVSETIPVLGDAGVEVDLEFTRHGPVVYRDDARGTAFAVRAAWLEAGMAPYLGSMDYMSAQNPDDFVAAMNRWGAPGENQVYASLDGTIGWQPAGRVPIRPNWDGTLPVPGDGRYEWAGYYDVKDLPSARNPEQGWFATANEMNLPADYDNASRTVSYDWYHRFRHDRLAEELSESTRWTVEDCVRLQTDYLSVPARLILPLLAKMTIDGDQALLGAGLLRDWDAWLHPDSAAAALFEVWYRRHLRPALLTTALSQLLPPERVAAALDRILPVEELAADARVDLDLLLSPGERLGPHPERVLPDIIGSTLAAAVSELAQRFGDDPTNWGWGVLHQAQPTHPLHSLLGGREWSTVGPLPRGGSGDTVGSTAYGPDFRQTAGATFRVVVDVGEWDESVAMNSPGQSGRPSSGHYEDHFELWASDGSFPLLYSRDRIEASTHLIISLLPPGS
jgi:penicillin amidase